MPPVLYLSWILAREGKVFCAGRGREYYKQTEDTEPKPATEEL